MSTIMANLIEMTAILMMERNILLCLPHLFTKRLMSSGIHRGQYKVRAQPLKHRHFLLDKLRNTGRPKKTE